MKPTELTIGDLKKSNYTIRSAKDEMRMNVIRKLRLREPLFPGIVGFEDTVIPQIVNALLAKHDILLLGLRGQAKTRIARLLVNFLDEYTPVVRGSEINDNPLAPISYHARTMIAEHGDDTPIEWIHRSERYGEKLATPDVSVADLIGDIDPIKAAANKLSYSHEGAIHYGIIPRTNRGVFVINELPDLQPRIQVALFNILQERDIQIRGFNVRLPLDMCIVFTANPEDYTNRGSIITPLKDRIDSQILTHYPRSMEQGMAITKENAWLQRTSEMDLRFPKYVQQTVEAIAICARSSEYVDQSSGVSARMTIATSEALVSNAERRAIINNENVIVPRSIDLEQAVAGITGKVELVFEGEQEGAQKVARALVGRGVREVLTMYLPNPHSKSQKRKGNQGGQAEESRDEYAPIVQYFEQGNSIALSDTMPYSEFVAELDKVPKLRRMAVKYLKVNEADVYELAPAMEFILEGLHQHSKIAKDYTDGIVSYKDMVGALFTKPKRGLDEDDLDELYR